MSGTGSAGMETCFVNLVERGDPVLILINGVFGMRMKDVASRLGAAVDALEFEWGTPVRVDDAVKKIRQKPYKIVAIVHAETSTGAQQPMEGLGKLCHDRGARLVAAGATAVQEPYHPGEAPDVWIATFADPDGNYFQLLSPMSM